MTCVNRSPASVVGAIIFGTAHSSSPTTSERFRFRRGVSPTERVFYPRTAAEVLALDILHDSGGQHNHPRHRRTSSRPTGRAPLGLLVLAV